MILTSVLIVSQIHVITHHLQNVFTPNCVTIILLMLHFKVMYKLLLSNCCLNSIIKLSEKNKAILV